VSVPQILGVHAARDSVSLEMREIDTGRVLVSGRAKFASGSDNHGEQDPTVWWQGLLDARHQAGGALGVAAISVAAQQRGLVALDSDGALVGPALVGDHFDSRSATTALLNERSPEDWATACGSVPDSSFSISKVASIRENRPDDYNRIVALLQPHDWLTYRLGRRAVTDRGDASATGYWSPRENRWRPDLLAQIDSERDWALGLPRVLESGEPAGDREGVVVAAGTGAPMAGALGLLLSPGDVVIDLGLGAQVFSVRELPVEDPTGSVFGFADASGRFMPLVPIVEARLIFDQAASVLGGDRGRFDQWASNSPPGAAGLVFAPPTNRSAINGGGVIAGRLFGIKTGISPENVARAVMEGVACAALDAVDALGTADVATRGKLFLIGGIARSHVLQQCLADLSGRAIYVSKTDPTVAGACLQAAAVTTGEKVSAIAAAWGLPDTRIVEPDPQFDAEEIRSISRAARTRR